LLRGEGLGLIHAWEKPLLIHGGSLDPFRVQEFKSALPDLLLLWHLDPGTQLAQIPILHISRAALEHRPDISPALPMCHECILGIMQCLMLLLASSGSDGAFRSKRHWRAHKEVWGGLRMGDDDSHLGWDQR